MSPLELIGLPALMERTSGRREVVVGLIDGPVEVRHPDLASGAIREVPGAPGGACTRGGSLACRHATFVAGVLCARRGSAAPAICPGCTLLVRPIFAEATPGGGDGAMPAATPQELAAALLDCIEAGVRVVNLSAALDRPSSSGERALERALDRAARRGVPVVAAAGNQGMIGGTAITRHPWVIPVVACDARGRPLGLSNLGGSIGRRGLGAPGGNVTSLGTEGPPLTLGGTSVAAPFVTGAIALLWSEFPGATAAEIRLALARAPRRNSIVPPLLDAWGAYRALAGRGRTSPAGS